MIYRSSSVIYKTMSTEIKKKIWMVVDKDDGEVLEVSLIGKDDLNIWDDSVVVKAEVIFKI